MTWYYDPSGTTMDVYDHTGTLVAENVAVAFNADGESIGSWTGTYPDRVKEIARQNMDGDQPSAYNQSLIADMSCDQIEQGTPP